MTIPPPTTFAEGQRKLYGIAAAGAGICIGLAICVGGSIVAFGDWGKDQLHFQLIILFALLAGAMLQVGIVIVGLLLGGPVGKFHGEASMGDKKVSLDADRAPE